MGTVFSHQDFGVAQAIKQIIVKSLSNAGLMQDLPRRIVTLGDMQQAHDFSRIAGKSIRESLGLPKQTSEIVNNWETLRQKTSVTRRENAESKEQAVRMHSALVDLNRGNQTRLASPFAPIATWEVFDDDPDINAMVEALDQNFKDHRTLRHVRTVNEDGAPATPHNYTGLTLGFELTAAGKPRIVVNVVRNNRLKTLSFIDDFVASLNAAFGEVVEFDRRLARWSVGNASILRATEPNSIPNNYFSKEHDTLRPGLSVRNSNNLAGSIAFIASDLELDRLLGQSGQESSNGERRFLISCKHVLFNPPGEEAEAQAKRLSTQTGADKRIGPVLQPASDIPWWIDFPNSPRDVAFARVEDPTWNVSSTVVGNTEFPMRLPKEDELPDLLSASGDAVLLGSSGPSKASLTQIDVDGPYIYKSSSGPVFLESTGLRMVQSLEKKIGREGNSGGPVVVDINTDQRRDADNVVVGMRVAGDEGTGNFTSINDRNAPQALYLPIYAVALEFDHVRDLLVSAGGDVQEPQLQSSSAETSERAVLPTGQINVDKLPNIDASINIIEYLANMIDQAEANFDRKVLTALKKEVRKLGGLIVRTHLHKSDDGKLTVVELHLANREVSPELHEIEQRFKEDAELRFVPDRDFMRSNARH